MKSIKEFSPFPETIFVAVVFFLGGHFINKYILNEWLIPSVLFVAATSLSLRPLIASISESAKSAQTSADHIAHRLRVAFVEGYFWGLCMVLWTVDGYSALFPYVLIWTVAGALFGTIIYWQSIKSIPITNERGQLWTGEFKRIMIGLGAAYFILLSAGLTWVQDQVALKRAVWIALLVIIATSANALRVGGHLRRLNAAALVIAALCATVAVYI